MKVNTAKYTKRKLVGSKKKKQMFGCNENERSNSCRWKNEILGLRIQKYY